MVGETIYCYEVVGKGPAINGKLWWNSWAAKWSQFVQIKTIQLSRHSKTRDVFGNRQAL